MERLASDFIPTVMSRGFHAGPVFGIFGAAVAASKVMGLSEEQLNSAIALCASLASGNLEGPRSGGQALREGGAVRNALLAASLAERGHVGGETVLEGEAGFYHAYIRETTRAALRTASRAMRERAWIKSPRGLGRSGFSSKRCSASIPPRATTWPTST